MTQVLKIGSEYDSGLFDSDNGTDCKTEKVVDITDECPRANPSNKCILLFTRAKRGPIVQITRPHKGEKYLGTHIHFFIKELEEEMRAPHKHDTFGLWADMLGISKTTLRSIIEAHAPAA